MISVCIATYNGEKYIREQLMSILPQLSEGDEVVISDDSSSDNTLREIESLSDKRIRVVSHQHTKHKFTIDYSTHNFENAIANSKGDVIFLADQDDKWTENKVEVMMEALKDADLVMSDCYVTDSDLNITCESYLSLRPFSSSSIRNLLKSSFLGSCMAFRREILSRAMPFPEYGVGHDLWLGLVALRYYRVKCVNRPLMYYRRHDNTVTVSGMQNTTSLSFKIRYRLYVVSSWLKMIFQHK